MEPLDPVLVKKLSVSIAKYLDSQKPERSREVKPIKAGSKDFQEILHGYSNKSRKGSEATRMWKPDTTDYALTEYIIKVIEDTCCVSFNELRDTSKRDQGMTLARSIFVYLERRLNNRSHPSIGAILNMHHTSSVHLAKKFMIYRDQKIFEVFMKNDRMAHLMECAAKRAWRWECQE